MQVGMLLEAKRDHTLGVIVVPGIRSDEFGAFGWVGLLGLSHALLKARIDLASNKPGDRILQRRTHWETGSVFLGGLDCFACRMPS